MKFRLLRWSVISFGFVLCSTLAFGAQEEYDTSGFLSVFAPEDPAVRAERIREAAAQPTPRLADGRPDLTGYWAETRVRGFDAVPISVSDDGNTITYHEPDAPELDTFAQPGFKARAANTSLRPQYKPEYQARQRELMHTASLNDPGLRCYPFGVPRIGAPTEIVHTTSAVYLLYAGESDEDPTHTYRVIPIGGQHDPERDPRPNGDSIAFWEGDTLVVDVVNIDPETWLDGDGTFHSDQLHVVERFTRKGNTIEYDVTINDPELFTEPWRPVGGDGGVLGRVGSKTMILAPERHAIPDYACYERDRFNKVNNDRF